MSSAYLILEDGTVFKGRSIGSEREVISEVVFNTSMTGYLEVLTDPSYAGQAVVMTYPLIGNYGICFEDMESDRPWPDAYIVRELSRVPSNFRSEDTIQNFLKRYDIPGIEGIDTRALTRMLREKGTMNGMVTTREYSVEEMKALLPGIRAYKTGDVVSKVTCREKYRFTDSGDTTPWPSLVGTRAELSFDLTDAADASAGLRGRGGETQGNRQPSEDAFPGDADTISAFDPALAGTAIAEKAEEQRKMQNIAARRRGRDAHFRVALMDFGAKRNIGRNLVHRGCEVWVYPAHTPAEEILADHPDGIMLSNGPGDPKDCGDIIREVRKLYESDVPIFAICLGHQLMALAAGADTYKMKYGHRGGNHPVRDLKTGRVYISSQNHGYVVDAEHMDKDIAVPAFENVNDGTNEGMAYVGKNIFTVQFHPEACPGPQDSGYLFDRFLRMMEADRERKAYGKESD